MVITLSGFDRGKINKRDCIAYFTYWINAAKYKPRATGPSELVFMEQLIHLRFLLALLKGEPTHDIADITPSECLSYLTEWLHSMNCKTKHGDSMESLYNQRYIFLSRAIGFARDGASKNKRKKGEK